MLTSARIIQNYINGKSMNDIAVDLQCQDATIRRLLVIAEASKRISDETQQQLTTIPWRAINGMRNRLVHEYDDIDLEVVWDTIHQSLPPLIVALEQAISTYGQDVSVDPGEGGQPL
ncbi:HepT-like ribonuclease domain-containing protein [Synechocystis sp. LKSZ1]|uniref:HepT-like ribonuclease domain-containing protein n=1 Tax=Synechocystis sp. LKSZ1 TaxID=3144951 RepID=UPI00336BDC13